MNSEVLSILWNSSITRLRNLCFNRPNAFSMRTRVALCFRLKLVSCWVRCPLSRKGVIRKSLIGYAASPSMWNWLSQITAIFLLMNDKSNNLASWIRLGHPAISVNRIVLVDLINNSYRIWIKVDELYQEIHQRKVYWHHRWLERPLIIYRADWHRLMIFSRPTFESIHRYHRCIQ